MKPESGRTRGSKADPQIRLQRGDGSISAETMVMTFFFFFFLLDFLQDKSFFFEQCVFFVRRARGSRTKYSLSFSACALSYGLHDICP